MKAIASSARGRACGLGSTLALCAFIFAVPAAADAVHGQWESRIAEGKCWAASQPASTTASGKRGPAYVSIQNQPSEGIRGSVAVVSGDPETGKGEVTLEVDGTRFEMLPYADAAFARSGPPEASLIAAMRKGREMKVTWTSPSGAMVVDTYSMDGFSAAKTEIDHKCR